MKSEQTERALTVFWAYKCKLPAPTRTVHSGTREEIWEREFGDSWTEYGPTTVSFDYDAERLKKSKTGTQFIITNLPKTTQVTKVPYSVKGNVDVQLLLATTREYQQALQLPSEQAYQVLSVRKSPKELLNELYPTALQQKIQPPPKKDENKSLSLILLVLSPAQRNIYKQLKVNK